MSRPTNEVVESHSVELSTTSLSISSDTWSRMQELIVAALRRRAREQRPSNHTPHE